ncbi:hypothetical protein [Photobacterium damselae]|uniref:hypothetical protein n=1 Tax=Photobacterium damselae TaxID=38293 RepID=UPI0015A3BCD0|nr:hypothetical protein [Photobacterium damselae]NVO60229.1 hypothetical protein [Photobacterium damselae subsp. damselae]
MCKTFLVSLFSLTLVCCTSTGNPGPKLVRDMTPLEINQIKNVTLFCPNCGNALTAINNALRVKCHKSLTTEEMKEMLREGKLYRFTLSALSHEPPVNEAAVTALHGIDCLNYNSGIHKGKLVLDSIMHKRTIAAQKQD